MIVPNYWAEGRKQHRAEGKQITVRRFGWSESSPDAAQAMADQRAADALAQILSGLQLPRREPKVPYNGADGVPIREEVLARQGKEVITRNSYGARCLNSPHALFADVDFKEPFWLWNTFSIWTLLNLVVVGVVMATGRFADEIGLMILGVGLLSLPIAMMLRRLAGSREGHYRDRARARVATFMETHPDWNLRLYETPNGIRLLATHRVFDPQEDEVSAFFKAIQADPIYQTMCLRQNCFRARLSAKPWRIGIDQHLRPNPGIWPVHPDRLPLREQWVQKYESIASNFAACHYVESFGSGVVDRELRRVIDLHDRESHANRTELTLA